MLPILKPAASCHLQGVDKLTIFVPKSGYLVKPTTQDSIGVGAAVEIWGETRCVGQRWPTSTT